MILYDLIIIRCITAAGFIIKHTQTSLGFRDSNSATLSVEGKWHILMTMISFKCAYTVLPGKTRLWETGDFFGMCICIMPVYVTETNVTFSVLSVMVKPYAIPKGQNACTLDLWVDIISICHSFLFLGGKLLL